MLIKNSAEFNIELNAKTNAGLTAFHYACLNGRTSIVDIMVNNFKAFKLNLTVGGRTGFQMASRKVKKLIQRKMPTIAF